MLYACLRENVTLPEKKSKEIQKLVEQLEKAYADLQSIDSKASESEYEDKLWDFDNLIEQLDIAAKLDDSVGREDYARYCFRYYVGEKNEDQ